MSNNQSSTNWKNQKEKEEKEEKEEREKGWKVTGNTFLF